MDGWREMRTTRKRRNESKIEYTFIVNKSIKRIIKNCRCVYLINNGTVKNIRIFSNINGTLGTDVIPDTIKSQKFKIDGAVCTIPISSSTTILIENTVQCGHWGIACQATY